MTHADDFWNAYSLAFAVGAEDGIELILAPTGADESNLVLRMTDEGITGRLRPADDFGQAADQQVALPFPIPAAVVDALMEAQPVGMEVSSSDPW